MAKKKDTYLIPIWVDIWCHGEPKDIMYDLNEKLMEFFEDYGQRVERNGNSIDIQWSVNQHVNLTSS